MVVEVAWWMGGVEQTTTARAGTSRKTGRAFFNYFCSCFWLCWGWCFEFVFFLFCSFCFEFVFFVLFCFCFVLLFYVLYI
jgi:hypothetical protein